MPSATEKPWPSEPVLVSTQGKSSTCGWPWKGLSSLRKRERRLLVAEAVMRADGVERRRGMAFGQHEAVARRIVDCRRPDIQLRAEQTGQNVGAGQRAARMAGAGVIDGGDDVLANEARGGRDLALQIRRRFGGAFAVASRGTALSMRVLCGKARAGARQKIGCRE